MDAVDGRALDVERYLTRIGYAGSRDPTPATLHALHRQHILTVPFENLDIPLGRPITLELASLWEKIVVHRRGGFCYELNTLFGRLLQALGYRADYLGARVWSGTSWGPDKDHMALRVEAGGASWLADVGFGDSFVTPLRLEPGVAQDAGFRSFRLRHDGHAWVMEAQDTAGDWKPGYRFTLDAHEPAAFAEMCVYQQTSPDTTFTRRVVCSRGTERGRVSVTHDRLIVTEDDERHEIALADAAAFGRALVEHQGIRLTHGEAETIVRRFAPQ